MFYVYGLIPAFIFSAYFAFRDGDFKFNDLKFVTTATLFSWFYVFSVIVGGLYIGYLIRKGEIN